VEEVDFHSRSFRTDYIKDVHFHGGNWHDKELSRMSTAMKLVMVKICGAIT
jgi:hypothetical protein